jgi:hypothetical protein
MSLVVTNTLVIVLPPTQRWQARGSDSANQQRITSEVGEDGELDGSLASQLDGLKLDATTDTPLSKKAQRQLRKQTAAASKRGVKQKKK